MLAPGLRSAVPALLATVTGLGLVRVGLDQLPLLEEVAFYGVQGCARCLGEPLCLWVLGYNRAQRVRCPFV